MFVIFKEAVLCRYDEMMIEIPIFYFACSNLYYHEDAQAADVTNCLALQYKGLA